MKILFPTITFHPAEIGGPNSTLYWHTLFLKENGIDPIIITSNLSIKESYNIKPNTWINSPFGKIIYLSDKNKRLPIKIIFRSISYLRKVEIIHFNSLFNTITISLIFFAVIFRKKVVLSPRGELFGPAISRKTIKKKVVLWFYNIIKHKIVFHSTSVEEFESIKNHFGNVYIEKQPNFILTQYYKKDLDYKKDILFIGRINPIKNIDILIEAASRSKAFMNSDSRLIIAGNTNSKFEEQYLKDLIAMVSEKEMNEKVFFIGHVDGENKINLLRRSYFLALPSKSENFGNVVVEALSCSTPVIASKGTPWQILEEYNAGFWVESTIEIFSDSFNLILSLSESDYKIMSSNSLSLIRTEFDVKSSKNIWLNIYNTIK